MSSNVEMRSMKTLSIILFSGISVLLSMVTHAERVSHEIEIDGHDFTIDRYQAEIDGNHLILWIAPGFGTEERPQAMAQRLADRGIEIWRVDLSDNLFLPRSTHTLRTIDGKYVSDLIAAAHRQTGKQITLMARSYAAIPVLHGARSWQLEHGDDDYLVGAILFSPELYRRIPSLGMPAEYMPVASASNIPIMFYQAGQRGNRWQMGDIIERLQSGGAELSYKLLPGVTGVFYHEDTAAETLAANDALPDEIPRVIRLLDRIPVPRQPPPMAEIEIQPTPLDIELTPFQAGFEPPALRLDDIDGERYLRDDYRGRVTVVNFWASWCGPCVEEIPALNNLREKMAGRPFELISVNYAEEEDKIREFLKSVKVDFPVLMDYSGKVSASWQVLVYPATYVIGPDGDIVYSVNGAIHWDSDAVIAKLDSLLGTAR